MLTSKQKSYLKGLAHSLQPIIQVGKLGVNEKLVKTVVDALEAHELIKVSVLQNCLEEPNIVGEKIAEQSGADVVQVIGRTLVLYNESKKKKQIVIPKS